MAEMTVSAPPVPPPSSAGGVTMLDQGDPAGRPVAGARPNPASGTESPFAAVLKSRLDKKVSNVDAADQSVSLPPAAQTDPGNLLVGVGAPGLVPPPGASLAAVTGTAAPPAAVAGDGPEEKRLPAVEAAAAASSTLLFAALPATSPAAPPGASPALPPATVDASGGRPNAETRDPTPTAAERAKPAAADPMPGKMGPDAAISADAGSKGSDKSVLAASATDFPALLERAAATMPVAGAAKPSPPDSGLRIDTPLGQTGWPDEMGQKLSWMLGNGRQQADLVLTPPHLGRVEVSLTLNGDQANAIFASSNPAVREALEGALHRLREVLADAGVSLGQTHVGSESPSRFSGQEGDGRGLGSHDDGRLAFSSRGVPVAGRTAIGRGMIDVFA